MNAFAESPFDTGLDVLDFEDPVVQAQRTPRVHDTAAQMEALLRIAGVFVQEPAIILQELVDAACNLCGADSAGISIERHQGTDQDFYHWVATAGAYSPFLDARLPRYPSACGICLERMQPQLFRVRKPFFDLLGVEAPLVTDGILLPWKVEETRGTIFIMAHGRTEAFDNEDCKTMQLLADFAAMAIRQQSQQKRLLEQAKAAAAAAMANELAHKINNPLQSLTNLLYLAGEGHYGTENRTLGQQASSDLARLSGLVRELLALPSGPESEAK